MIAGEKSARRASTEVVSVVLAAGAGTRLRPLTFERPKALCPVGNRPLVDVAVDRVRAVGGDVAVNVHHGRELLEAHLALTRPDVWVSVEEAVALGTAGAIGNLREWVDGRGVLVTNADAWLPISAAEVHAFVAGWDGERARLLVSPSPTRPDFDGQRYVGLSLLSWAQVARLPATPAGLYEQLWRAEHEAGRLDLVPYDGPFVDCGTPADYLAANVGSARATVSGPNESVVSPDAVVNGEVVRSVVWNGARVWPGERLVDAIRTPARTVLVRS